MLLRGRRAAPVPGFRPQAAQHRKGGGAASQLIILIFTSGTLRLLISVEFELQMCVFWVSGFIWSFITLDMVASAF